MKIEFPVCTTAGSAEPPLERLFRKVCPYGRRRACGTKLVLSSVETLQTCCSRQRLSVEPSIIQVGSVRRASGVLVLPGTLRYEGVQEKESAALRIWSTQAHSVLEAHHRRNKVLLDCSEAASAFVLTAISISISQQQRSPGNRGKDVSWSGTLSPAKFVAVHFLVVSALWHPMHAETVRRTV